MENNVINQAVLKAFRFGLHRWFTRQRRDLPWRVNRSPYRVAVSEFMLQQTQVATVIPYFEKWMKRFPDWKSLASASEAFVLKQWEGLGYYSRARNLHRLAKQIVQLPSGELPASVPDLLKLPGIGPYTAGAISSIAFHQPVPAVDGNVSRVLCRVFNLSTPLNTPSFQKYLSQLASLILNSNHPGQHNEAMMELGATICTPRSPKCLLCPLQSVCKAPEPERLPIKNKIVIEKRNETVAVIQFPDSKKFWCEPITGQDRLQDMWRFPDWNSSTMNKVSHLTQFKYSITRYRIDLSVVRATWKSQPHKKGKWMSIVALNKVSMPAAHRKIIQFIINPKSA